jgi:hypothetical protein
MDKIMETENICDYASLTERYLALWNAENEEPLPIAIRNLWSDGGSHTSPRIAVRGFDEIEARVARSCQRWIVEEGYRFRSKGDVSGHHNIVRFSWEMIDGRGNVESIGTEILVLNEVGRISSAYQFIEQ